MRRLDVGDALCLTDIGAKAFNANCAVPTTMPTYEITRAVQGWQTLPEMVNNPCMLPAKVKAGFALVRTKCPDACNKGVIIPHAGEHSSGNVLYLRGSFIYRDNGETMPQLGNTRVRIVHLQTGVISKDFVPKEGDFIFVPPYHDVKLVTTDCHPTDQTYTTNNRPSNSEYLFVPMMFPNDVGEIVNPFEAKQPSGGIPDLTGKMMQAN